MPLFRYTSDVVWSHSLGFPSHAPYFSPIRAHPHNRTLSIEYWNPKTIEIRRGNTEESEHENELYQSVELEKKVVIVSMVLLDWAKSLISHQLLLGFSEH